MSDFSDLPWFLKEYIHENRWDSFRNVQTDAFEAFRKNDDHLIISSATSSGKTEAALFPIISSLYNDPTDGIGALYIGPLKALIDDQFERIRPMIEKSGIKVTGWHGDISTSMKKKLMDEPSGFLQITPESLQNIIMNHNELLVRLFSGLRFVIIDEIHVFIPSARGTQILCCLETIERMTGCGPRRIGLSATLHDSASSGSWLSANTGRGVTMVEESTGRDADISIIYNRFPASMEDDPVSRKKAITDYYKELFGEVNGRNCLIFTNSRTSAERTARSLDVISERYGQKGLVSIHHSSISKEFRKNTEERMKDRYRKTVTVATSSLELGIDVGEMERIVQIDPPMSCMSMLQRMGRSGRRGGKQNLVIMCNDDKERPWMNVLGVSVDLIRAIAMVELAREGWSEPLEEDPLPYGMLFHQTLRHMASGLGCRFSELKEQVLSMYPFRNITEDDYRILLKHMLSTNVIERMADRTLLIGRNGERIVFGRDFCSVFDFVSEIDIFFEGRCIGSIQGAPEVGDNIQLAGGMWNIISVSKDASRADVRPTNEGSCLPWKSGAPPIDDAIIMKMRDILSCDDEYDYLNEKTSECLAHSRSAFSSQDMDCLYSITDNGIRIFPWIGTRAFDTLRRIVVSINEGSVYAQAPYYIEVRTKKPGIIEKGIRDFIAGGNAGTLIDPAEDFHHGKFDGYLPEVLLKKAFIANWLDVKRLKLR